MSGPRSVELAEIFAGHLYRLAASSTVDGRRSTPATARDRRRALLRAVGSSPELTRRYFNTVAGIRPVSESYTPEPLAMFAA
jgi:hypothetical protein